jgi:hypothetical protein
MQDGFHRALKEELEKLIQREYSAMINISGDTAEQIAMLHRYSTGYVRAIDDVKTICQQVEDKMYKREAA